VTPLVPLTLWVTKEVGGSDTHRLGEKVPESGRALAHVSKRLMYEAAPVGLGGNDEVRPWPSEIQSIPNAVRDRTPRPRFVDSGHFIDRMVNCTDEHWI
jgi:hypothetical protein